MGDVEAWFSNLPVVTKTLLVGSVGVTLAGNLGVVSPVTLILSYYEIVYQFEIWRLLTTFFFTGKLSFAFFFNMLYLYRQSVSLEQEVFRGRTSDYLFMILFGCFLLLGIGLFMGFPLLGQGLLLMLTYYWSRTFPNVPLNFFGIPFQGRYLPWFLVGLNFLMGGYPIVQIFGIIVGHTYFILKDVAPVAYGVDILKTPWFLYQIFPPEYNDNSPGFRAARNVGQAARRYRDGFAGDGYRL